MTWLELVVLLLRLVNSIVQWAERQSWIDEGRRQIIAEQVLLLADKVKIRDQIRAKVEGMSDAEVDDELMRLGNARDVSKTPAR